MLWMLLVLIIGLALFDVVAFRLGRDSRDWCTSGEWNWLRRPTQSNGTNYDD